MAGSKSSDGVMWTYFLLSPSPVSNTKASSPSGQALSRGSWAAAGFSLMLLSHQRECLNLQNSGKKDVVGSGRQLGSMLITELNSVSATRRALIHHAYLTGPALGPIVGVQLPGNMH